MVELGDLMTAILARYEATGGLSNAELTKLVYLVDWRWALVTGEPATDVRWRFDHFGPFVWDVLDLARSDGRFNVRETTNMYGTKKVAVSLAEGCAEASLDPDVEREVAKMVEIAKAKSYDEFIKLVYSTYPIQSSARYDELDLKAKAAEFKRKQSGDAHR